MGGEEDHFSIDLSTHGEDGGERKEKGGGEELGKTVESGEGGEQAKKCQATPLPFLHQVNSSPPRFAKEVEEKRGGGISFSPRSAEGETEKKDVVATA